MLYQDILLGRLRPVDAQTGKPIPVKKLLTIDMPADTVMEFDTDDPEKLTAYRVVQKQRNPRDFNRIRIKQELYFDFKNERLYSVIRSVTLLETIYGNNRKTVIGWKPFSRLD